MPRWCQLLQVPNTNWKTRPVRKEAMITPRDVFNRLRHDFHKARYLKAAAEITKTDPLLVGIMPFMVLWLTKCLRCWKQPTFLFGLVTIILVIIKAFRFLLILNLPIF